MPAIAAGVFFAAAPASAQSSSIPCGIPTFQPESVFFFYLEQVGELFTLGEKECIKITKQAVAACHMAVRESEQCLQDLLVSMFKSSKVGCEGNGECIDEFLAQHAMGKQEISESAQEGHEECDEDFAEAMFEACFEGGLPN